MLTLYIGYLFWNMKHTALILLIIGWGFITLGDIFFKKWSIENHISPYVIGMIFYCIGIVCFGFTLKEKNLAVASTILVTANTITIVLVSFFYFKEKFTLIQGIGIFLSIIAVVLLEWE